MQDDSTLDERVLLEAVAAFSARGLKVELHPDGVRIVNTMTPEQHRVELSRLAQDARDSVDEITRLTGELETVLLQYNAFDMLATLAAITLMNDPETFKEYEQKSLSVHVEFPTQLYLKHPFSEGDGSPLVPGPILEGVEQLVRKICKLQIFQWQYQDIDRDRQGVDKAVNDLRRRTLVNEFTIRELAYPHHLRLILSELFTPFSDWFTGNIGFDFPSLLRVLNGIRDLVHTRVNERRRESGIFVETLRQTLEQYGTGGEEVDPGLLPLVEEIAANLEAVDPEEYLQGVGVQNCFRQFGNLLSFNPQDVADKTGVDLQAVRAILACFAQEFGSEDDSLRAPRPLLTIRTRPLVHHGGRYLAPNPQLLLPAVQARLEDILKTAEPGQQNGVWQRYESHRASYLESKVLQLLGRIMPGAELFRSLRYRFVYEKQEQEFELDGLLLFGDAVFLVECKAGLFSDPARRGAQRTMVTDLKELVAKAFEQGVRAKNYIERTESPRFTTKSGREVGVDKTCIRHLFIVTVTLDTLYTFTTVLGGTAKLEIFPEEELPWAVSLADLMVIADMVEWPSQFVHYLKRRQAVNVSELLFTMDELDWFGKYLDDGLNFESLGADVPARTIVASYTTEMDEWYRHQVGERQTDSPIPRQQLSERLRALLARLEQERPDGYLGWVVKLLDVWTTDRWRLEADLQHFDWSASPDTGTAVQEFLAEHKWIAGQVDD